MSIQLCLTCGNTFHSHLGCTCCRDKETSKMTKKDEAAAAHAEDMVHERNLAWPPSSIESTIIKDFKSGWAQGQEAFYKAAITKIFTVESPDDKNLNVAVIKLDDLKAIKDQK